jgi:hypothetical protein
MSLALGIVLLVAGLAGGYHAFACMTPAPFAAFGLVLFARWRGGGAVPALAGSGTVATFAWLNQLTQLTEGRDYEVANAFADVYCCGLSGIVLAVTALAVLLWPAPRAPGPSEEPDRGRERCPNCGALGPSVRDGFCRDCRRPLGDTTAS